MSEADSKFAAANGSGQGAEWFRYCQQDDTSKLPLNDSQENDKRLNLKDTSPYKKQRDQISLHTN